MKILVTGATGFVGKKLLSSLIKEGHQINITSRNKARALKEISYPVNIYEWQPSNEALSEEAMEGVEVVINLMGENIAAGRWSQARKNNLFDSRIKATENLLRSFKNFERSKLKRIVSATAIGFYGDRGVEDLDETSSKGTGFLSDLCDNWEKIVDSVYPGDELHKIFIRIGLVLGEGGALEKMLPPFLMGAGGRLGSGKQYMSWIHIDDLVSLISFSVNTEGEGIINATSPEPVTNAEFTKVLAKSIKRPAIFPVPGFVLKVLLGEMSEMLLGGQKVLPKKALQLGFKFKFNNLSSALGQILSKTVKGEQVLSKSVYVDKDIKEVFSFFSDEKNLEKITPQFLNFKVVGKSTDEMQNGTLIDYKLKIRGIPARWQSKIDDWEPNKSFTDQQIIGPYSKWHHTHSFTSYNGGTIVHDYVSYKVPGGLLGRLFLGFFIRKDLEKIFSFRQTAIKEIF